MVRVFWRITGRVEKMRCNVRGKLLLNKSDCTNIKVSRSLSHHKARNADNLLDFLRNEDLAGRIYYKYWIKKVGQPRCSWVRTVSEKREISENSEHWTRRKRKRNTAETNTEPWGTPSVTLWIWMDSYSLRRISEVDCQRGYGRIEKLYLIQ